MTHDTISGKVRDDAFGEAMFLTEIEIPEGVTEEEIRAAFPQMFLDQTGQEIVGPIAIGHGTIDEEEQPMSRYHFNYDALAHGRGDALAEVRILQHRGLWTQELRAHFIKQAESTYEHLKYAHCLPQTSAYYAGRLSALKSRLTAVVCEQEQQTKVPSDRMIYRPLVPQANRACALFDCGEKAVWGVSFQGDSQLYLVLCDCCRQEWVRMTQVYVTLDGWDWHEDDEDVAFMVPPDRHLAMKKDALALGRIVLPLALLMGFDLSNFISPTSHRAMFAELGLVVLARCTSPHVLRLLFFLSGLVNGKEQS